MKYLRTKFIDKLSTATNLIFISNSINLIVVTLQSIIVTPILINKIGHHQYGIWVSTGEIIVWLQSLDFGISNFAIQKMSMSHSQQDRGKLLRWFTTTALILFALSIVALILCIFASDIIFSGYNLNVSEAYDLGAAFIMAAIGSCLTLTSFSLVGYLRAIQNVKIMSLSLISSSVIGLLTTFVLIRFDYGVTALGIGALVRSIVYFLGCLTATKISIEKNELGLLKFDTSIFLESAKIIPYSSVGSLSYAASNQSELLIASHLGDPSSSAKYFVTKRLTDVFRSLLETFTYANFASFSAEYFKNPSLAASLYARILNMHTLLSIIFGILIIVLNEILVKVWVGGKSYLGDSITLLLAMQMYFSTKSYLINSLHRAIQPPKLAYTLLLLESLLKIFLVILLFKYMKLLSLPIAGCVSSALSIYIMSKANYKSMYLRDKTWWCAPFALLLTHFLFINFSWLGLLPIIVSAVALCIILMTKRRILNE